MLTERPNGHAEAHLIYGGKPFGFLMVADILASNKRQAMRNHPSDSIVTLVWHGWWKLRIPPELQNKNDPWIGNLSHSLLLAGSNSHSNQCSEPTKYTLSVKVLNHLMERDKPLNTRFCRPAPTLQGALTLQVREYQSNCLDSHRKELFSHC